MGPSEKKLHLHLTLDPGQGNDLFRFLRSQVIDLRQVPDSTRGHFSTRLSFSSTQRLDWEKLPQRSSQKGSFQVENMA